jgi:hypothetical protein
MPEPDYKKNAAVKARRANAPADEAHSLLARAERWLRSADQLGYVISRWVIPVPYEVSRRRAGSVVSKWAHDDALHYLTRAREYQLDDTKRRQLTEVVHGYTDQCDETSAHAGIEWMRDQARHRGERVRF